jgi:predicted dehydrogenase
MTPLRFGVVGCGAIATQHQIPALRRARDATLAAVVDVDGGWAAEVARRFAVPIAHTDAGALVGRVDAVVLATPNRTHADLAALFLGAGVHVLCEKPMATTRADAERMFDAAARGGARLMAGQCLRFSANIAFLSAIVAEGWLGEIGEIDAAIGAPYGDSAHRTDFRRQKQSAGGGALVDLGVHVVDLALALAGGAPLDVLYDASTEPGWEVETDAEVVLAFPTGPRAVLTASFTRWIDAALTVRGTDGWASASLYRSTDLQLFRRSARICRAAGVQELRLPAIDMYDAQLAHFCACVRSGAPFRITADQVRAAMDVIDRCYGVCEADAA